MFNTSIHWTTFFYLLADSLILLIIGNQLIKQEIINCKRYMILGGLFITYNITGGFLPIKNFPGPYTLQYIIANGVSIILCFYIIYYLFKENRIIILTKTFKIKNFRGFACLCLIILFPLPYYTTNSLIIIPVFFVVPLTVFGFYFLWVFNNKIKKFSDDSKLTRRRNQLSVLGLSSVTLLPLMTVIGDYQWITFTVMNISFYAITTIEIDKYLYFLENKYRIIEIFSLEGIRNNFEGSTIMYQGLTKREIEIALSILARKPYKTIARKFFISERTVSKHASNIFKKMMVRNKGEFLNKFGGIVNDYNRLSRP